MATDYIAAMLGDDAPKRSSIVGGLFGLDPNIIARQEAMQQLQGSRNEAMGFAQMDPYQRANYMMYQGGAGLAGGLMGAVGPKSATVQRAEQEAALKQRMTEAGISLDSPQGFIAGARLAVEMGMPDLAAKFSMAGAQLDKEMSTAAKARRVDTSEVVDQGLYQAALQKAGGDPLKAAQIYKEEETNRKSRVAAAGAAQFGQEKIGNLTGAQSLVEGYTKKPYERLQAIGETQQFLTMASEGNTAAVPHLKRALVKLAGNDSQIAAKEIAGIAGSAGVAGNVSRAVENFFTGNPTKEDIKLIGKVISGAERVIGTQYMQGRQQAETVLDAAKLDPKTRAALLPPAYKLPEPQYPNAPKVGTVQNGYRFNGGNPADQNNWSKL